MKTKIIVDSSSNLTAEDFPAENFSFAVVPLTLTVNGKDFIDDGSREKEFEKELENSEAKVMTSCPAPGSYLKELEGADQYVIITLTSKLSGSYSSALTAKSLATDPEKVLVVDSMGAAGSLEQLALRARDYAEEGLTLQEMEKKLNEDSKKIKLLFSLERYDSLLKAGRVSKFIAGLAMKLHIRLLGIAENGQIAIKEKLHTVQGVFKRLVFNIGKTADDFKERICILSHTGQREEAESLKEEILRKYPFKNVIVRENKGIVRYYGNKNAILVSY